MISVNTYKSMYANKTVTKTKHTITKQSVKIWIIKDLDNRDSDD